MDKPVTLWKGADRVRLAGEGPQGPQGPVPAAGRKRESQASLEKGEAPPQESLIVPGFNRLRLEAYETPPGSRDSKKAARERSKAAEGGERLKLILIFPKRAAAGAAEK